MVMAAITPSTDLMLLKCPLEVDQQNQLTFANATAQYNYFAGLPKLSVDDFTYQRKDSTIRYNAHIDTIRGYNYCMYRNSNYTNKWFYAFITDMKYLNDGVTLITIKTDVWQSWMFNIEVKASYVKREHTNNDSIGANTLEEDLPIGEPIINGYKDFVVASNDQESQRVAMQVTELPTGIESHLPAEVTQRVYNGIPQGCYFLIFNQISSLQNLIRWYDKNTKANAILALFLVPSTMVSNVNYGTYTVDGTSMQVGFLPKTFAPASLAVAELSYSSTLNGYTPKNNKMYCYPYSYLYVSNNSGSDIIYHYEDWVDPTHPLFIVKGVITQGCSVQAVPSNYKSTTGSGSYGSYGISCGKLPILSWTSDYYLNWQAQNATNNAVIAGIGLLRGSARMSEGAVKTATAAASGEASTSGISQMVGGALDMVDTIREYIHENRVADLVPLQAQGNTNCGDLTYSMQKCGFTFRKMSCRYEYAAMIDNFFSMFGYKVNKVKVPNIYGRSNWNFVQCVQPNVLGDIPQDDMQEIKGILTAGVTFWHNPSTYLDYSQTNAII